MSLSHEFPACGSSYGGISSTCLEDKFELLKDIGDGSFGSVALARVRTAGAYIARRGTLVCRELTDAAFSFPNKFLGRNQDNEEDLRIIRTLPRSSRGYLSPICTLTRPPCSRTRHLSRPAI